MERAAIEKAGTMLWDARQNGTQLAALPDECRPSSIEEAYAIQDALTAASGLAVAGYKVGATNANVQAKFGVDTPFSGRVFAPFVSASPSVIPRGAVNFYVIEAEFDFHMARGLPPRAAPYTREELREAVASVSPAIEVPDSRYEDWLTMTAADLVADNAIGAHLTVGAPAAGGLDHDLAGQAVTVRVNGEVVSEGAGANVLGDPWEVMVWLANNLSSRGFGLEAGQVVTTGSAADVVSVSPGDTVVAEFGALGDATVHFEG